ncbi:uncharacterized protein LOC122364896 [Amphibalanus amphitrite]|uniref:uncharacterized protein LOC122364896 n=1 Tax=Amphibalanus amphitrite TaxID=1232801 RepID=UPI001C9194AC|nr:uncharacterized protein LOC122364896 [Amphibalanus amphitrite]
MGAATFTGVWCIASLLVAVSGHGRLQDPPCRASMWRFGYDTLPDYTDNQLFCGGKDHEEDMGGKCGICGDPYDEPQPRTHEIGGPYYKGYLVQNYTSGEVVTVTVNLTANHLGFFQFKICPVEGFETEATQECLDEGILEIAGTGSTDYYVTDETKPFMWTYSCRPTSSASTASSSGATTAATRGATATTAQTAWAAAPGGVLRLCRRVRSSPGRTRAFGILPHSAGQDQRRRREESTMNAW